MVMGRGLKLGVNTKAAIKAFLTEDISLERVSSALVQVLEAPVILCNSTTLRAPGIKDRLKHQLIKVAESTSKAADVWPFEEKASDLGTKGMVSAPIFQSRYMKDYTEEQE